MKKLLLYPIFLFLFVGTFTSCDNLDDVEAPPVQNMFLVNAEKVETYTAQSINGFIALAKFKYPELSALDGKLNFDVDVHKITYNTTFKDKKVQASGLVCLPKTTGSLPILSYHNGTNTLNIKAPSENPDDVLFKLLEMVASNGFIVSIPDYLGFGASSSMFHPYLHQESTVHSITDMFKAIKELLKGEDISLNNELYLSGYSQGGWTTMQMQKAIETSGSSGFTVAASACGASPFNLNAVIDYVLKQDEYQQPYFLGYLFNSFQNLGMTTKITDVLQQPYADRLPTLYDGTLSGGQINEQLTTTTADLFTADFISNWNTDDKYASLREMLTSNSVGAYETNVPTLLLHGTEDTNVPKLVTDQIYDAFMALGVSSTLVKKVELEGHSHKTGIIPSGLTSILWFIEMKDGD